MVRGASVQSGGLTSSLELPEEIDLQVQVASVGSRSLALLVDLALIGLVLFVFYGLATLTGRNGTAVWWDRFNFSAVVTFLLLLVFGFQWGYFHVFEWVWNGQTPGKRLLRLRVIKADGSPVGWIDVLLRNLARPIDTFGPMALIGLASIFFHPRARRPGDILADTLVIHETTINWTLFDEAPTAHRPERLSAPSIRLSPGQWELLQRFLNRREKLAAPVRARLAASLYQQLWPLAEGTDLGRPSIEPEEWLVELSRRT